MSMSKSIGIVSFRLGGTDGVSIEASKWSKAFSQLGHQPISIAGAGPVDRLVDGLDIVHDTNPVSALDLDALERVLFDLDIVVIENVCSLPLNKPARTALFDLLTKRRAIFHHHDLPWQRERFINEPPPKDTPCWRHVVINDLSQHALRERGIEALRMYNSFTPRPRQGDRTGTRNALGFDVDERVVLQPTRAIVRKNVEGGLRYAEALNATYWLLGPPEDGFDPTLKALLGSARCPVVHAGVQAIENAYAAADVIVMPSIFEGFGNPSLESATYLRPLAISTYPVALELRRFGFRWFRLDDPDRMGAFLDDPDPSLFEYNRRIVEEHFNVQHLPGHLKRLLDDLDD
jgi:glycosyltransferase involved in cell wall biosynthesis